LSSFCKPATAVLAASEISNSSTATVMANASNSSPVTP
jgi:hypothetical protein